MKPVWEYSFDPDFLRQAYRSGSLKPAQVLSEARRRIAAYDDPSLFLSLASEEALRDALEMLDRSDIESLPLYGIPFVIKDNIDVAGFPTTAACPEYAFRPRESAEVVRRLTAAGAIPLGKTNLDQFATGLVGTRSPHGTPRNPYGDAWIPGGSSSGSAAAVSAGFASFALGTDTAGSGRVPAALQHLAGWKPTRGLASIRGVVPAVRSLDCVSVFTEKAAGGYGILELMAAYDAGDPFSRRPPDATGASRAAGKLRIGVPELASIKFFGGEGCRDLFAQACNRFGGLGHTLKRVDWSPLREAAKLLYEGPYVAERFAAVGEFLLRGHRGANPVVKDIILGGTRWSAVDAYRASYRLMELRREAEAIWEQVDALLLPTTGGIWTHEQVAQDPVGTNSALGRYTNFANLCDLCALALPSGFLESGAPQGVTLFAPAFQESLLLQLGSEYESRCPWSPSYESELGDADGAPATGGLDATQDTVPLFVLGAHLSGFPLNGQLLEAGGRLEGAVQTAPHYRFYHLDLPGTPKPGLVRVGAEGAAIEGEVWRLPARGFASVVSAVPRPLCIGEVELADGRSVPGFLCVPEALTGAEDITAHGGWRRYREAVDRVARP